jgi:hypothetical protein
MRRFASVLGGRMKVTRGINARHGNVRECAWLPPNDWHDWQEKNGGWS